MLKRVALALLALAVVVTTAAAVIRAQDRTGDPIVPPAGDRSPDVRAREPAARERSRSRGSLEASQRTRPSPRRGRAGRLRESCPARRPALRGRSSRALGLPHRGRLEDGVRLPCQGDSFFTWDPINRSSPNRSWRRHGTDRLVRLILTTADRYAADHPSAPRLAVGDLSRPRGGNFGPRFGRVGHASHQNGLDVDVYYPRRDRRERAPRLPRQVDRRLAQDLVERFVAAGAERVFVGPRVGLDGPPSVVQVLARHDDHLHVRLPGR